MFTFVCVRACACMHACVRARTRTRTNTSTQPTLPFCPELISLITEGPRKLLSHQIGTAGHPTTSTQSKGHGRVCAKVLRGLNSGEEVLLIAFIFFVMLSCIF